MNKGILSGAILIAAMGTWLLTGCQNAKEENAPAAQTAAPVTNCKEAPDTAPLAMIDGKEIGEKDLDGRAKGILTKARAEMYDARKQALDEFVFNHLVGLEAAKAKITKEELTKKELDGKIKKVTDKEIKAFYDDFAKRGGGQLPPLAQVSDKIKMKLEQDRIRERRTQYFDDLKKAHKVAYLITRPRLEVGLGENPVKGNAKASITIVEFSDFQCPFCKRAEVTVDQVMKEYKGKVKLYFRDFPLGFHPNAKPAAIAARCAGEQGKFWEFHGKLFDKQELGDEKYKKYAGELSLNMDKFNACLTSPKIAASVDKDMEAGSDLGVSGTPAFFIDGIMLSGAVPYSEFKEILDDEIRLARAPHKG
ncbi:MAG: DsbA family protein [Pseudomonadota bacterium]